MNESQLAVITECSGLSCAGEISFGDVVQRLAKAGVERYHADYSRMETSYYLADGTSCVLPLKLSSGIIAEPFSASQVETSVRQAQRGELKYPGFVEQTRAAGCVGYFVLITGQRVQYLGRKGEIHTEWFPGAKRD